MPELPEVEVHRRHLDAWLAGHSLVELLFKPAGMLAGTTPASLETNLQGARFLAPLRRGKHLAVPVAGGGALYLHLGMTGHFSRRQGDEAVPRFQTLSLHLENGTVVDFTDARRFSKVGWLPDHDVTRYAPFNALGPDLLLSPPSAKELRDLLSRTQRPLKVALMDQGVVAGLGNIHASEALWRARIHPNRLGSSLTLVEARQLLAGIAATFQLVLQDDDGETLPYVTQGAPNPFSVYGREGERCARCRKGEIERAVQAGRSTFWCPVCQSSNAG